MQLREKQKAKRAYGVLETQFHRYFESATREKGITGENLLVLLERRLDNVVYRCGFGSSRAQARQLVRHGHIRVNGKKVNIPSFLVNVGDVITIREKSAEAEHFKALREGSGKMVLGYFGKTPVEPDPEVVKEAAEQLKLEPTKEKVVDLNDKNPGKGRAAAIKMLKDAGLAETEENIFIAASCKEKGILYLTGKAKVNGVRLISQTKKDEPKAASKNDKHEYTVTVGGKAYGVKIDGGKAIVNGVEYPLAVEDGIKAGAAPQAKKVTKTTGSTEVKAPMPGLALRFEVNVGDTVKKDQVLCVMEAMKMENEIYAPCDGVVSAIVATQGAQLQAGDTLMTIGGTVVEETVEEVKAEEPKAAPSANGGSTSITAPMPGLALRFEVKVGDAVKKDQVLCVMEAMKMENEIYAPCDGTVASINVNQGDQLQAGDVIMTLA